MFSLCALANGDVGWYSHKKSLSTLAEVLAIKSDCVGSHIRSAQTRRKVFRPWRAVTWLCRNRVQWRCARGPTLLVARPDPQRVWCEFVAKVNRSLLLETTLKRCVLLWKPHRRRACCFGNHTEKVPAVLETTPKRYVLFWKPRRKGTCCFGNHTEKVRAVLDTQKEKEEKETTDLPNLPFFSAL